MIEIRTAFIPRVPLSLIHISFFTQERPGKNGRIFKVIKFKTMTDERNANGDLLPDADRPVSYTHLHLPYRGTVRDGAVCGEGPQAT